MPNLLEYPSIPTKTLKANLSSTGSAFQLNDIKEWDGSTDLASSDFGTTAYAVLRNATKTKIEIIQFDPTTIASTSITILARGLGYGGGSYYSEVAANKLDWNANETFVELGTNPPQLYGKLLNTGNAATIAAVYTFGISTRPKLASDVDTSTNEEFVTLGQLNRTALGTTLTDRVVVAGTAGETVAAGDWLYFKEADQEWYKSDASASATSRGVILGVAQGAGTDGNAISNGVLRIETGQDLNQTGLTPGSKYYLSDTAGEISDSAGTVEVLVGIAKDATTLYTTFLLDVESVTAAEKDALAGNDGTPSSANKYVTQSGFQKGTEVYAADAEASDTYVITLAPAIAAYTTGQVIQFKANTANTGAATININGLGAKTIKKNVTDDLDDNDIRANEITSIVYDGTNFQLLGAPVISRANATDLTDNGFTYLHNHMPTVVQTTRAYDAASGDVNVAHGLGRTPKWVRIIGSASPGLEVGEHSIGFADGTNNQCNFVDASVGSGSVPLTRNAAGNGASAAVHFKYSSGAGVTRQQEATITFDDTNIIFAWTKTDGGGGSGTHTIYLHIEVYG